MNTWPLRILGGFCAAVLLSGCCLTHLGGDMVLGPTYTPSNIYGAEQPLPPAFRRVAVLPLQSISADTESARDNLDLVLRQELGKSKRFELVPISAAALAAATGTRSWTTAEPLPRELLQLARETYGCDGILFSEVTQVRAYPPLTLGWNLKLVEVRSGTILWAADEVFDAGQPAVANGARLYEMDRTGMSSALADSRMALISPTAFAHYSAHCLFGRLPPPAGPQVFAPLTDKQMGTSRPVEAEQAASYGN